MTAETIERKPEHKQQNRLSAGFGITPMEWVGSALIGIGTAIAAAIGTVRTRFSEDMKNATDIKQKVEEHAQVLAELKPEGNMLKNENLFYEAVKSLKMGQAAEIEGMIQDKYNFSKNFFKSTLQRAKTFTDSSRRPIVVNAIIGSIIGTAMAVSFFNSVAIRDKINQVDDAIEPKGDSKHPRAKHLSAEDEKPYAKTKPAHTVTEATSEKKLVAEVGQGLAS